MADWSSRAAAADEIVSQGIVDIMSWAIFKWLRLRRKKWIGTRFTFDIKDFYDIVTVEKFPIERRRNAHL